MINNLHFTSMDLGSIVDQ